MKPRKIFITRRKFRKLGERNCCALLLLLLLLLLLQVVVLSLLVAVCRHRRRSGGEDVLLEYGASSIGLPPRIGRELEKPWEEPCNALD